MRVGEDYEDDQPVERIRARNPQGKIAKTVRAYSCSRFPGKRRFDTQGEIESAISTMPPWAPAQLRAYFCRACKGWHMTSMPAMATAAIPVDKRPGNR